ncbi:MAG: aldo/keto reductase [Candidatus Hodarchaeales archaeon]|jgi:predicted aldo/keto reductase-like oxidoreductase
MKYRLLGNSSLKISEIGVGTEYLARQSSDTIIQTVQAAFEAGINYFDILFAFPNYLQAIGKAIDKTRNKINLAIHIGSGEKNGKHRKIRSPISARKAFESVLSCLQIESIDIAVIQNVVANEYDKIMKPTGLIKFAEELKENQLTKYLGISIHSTELALKAISTGKFDLLMSQFNLFAEENSKRQELVQRCHDMKIAFIAIKPYAGGNLLKTGRKVRVPSYKSGGEVKETKIPKIEYMTIRCLSYILDQKGVTSVIPGVKNVNELQQTLTYCTSNPQQKDYQSLLEYFNNH